jgi:hypothetical protein
MNTKGKSPKIRKIKWIAVLVIFILVCLFALSLSSYMNSIDVMYASTMDKPVDQIVVLPLLCDDPSECPAWTTDDQKIINRWKDALTWTNSYAICCDEETTHTILALQDGEIVYYRSYGGLSSGYNNWTFSWRQWQLVRQFKSSETKSYRYLVYAPHGTDFDKMRQEMQSEHELFMYKNAGGELFMITPTKLTKDQRDDVEKRWDINILKDRVE